MRASLALVLFVAATAHAEYNCGRMDRSVTHVPAPVRIAEMHIVWLKCDGEFRRFEEAIPSITRTVEEYDRWLEPGHVYRATVVGRELDPLPRMPYHHIGGIVFTNENGVLPDDGRRRTIVFEVTGQWIQQREEGLWANLLDGFILEVH